MSKLPQHRPQTEPIANKIFREIQSRKKTWNRNRNGLRDIFYFFIISWPSFSPPSRSTIDFNQFATHIWSLNPGPQIGAYLERLDYFESATIIVYQVLHKKSRTVLRREWCTCCRVSKVVDCESSSRSFFSFFVLFIILKGISSLFCLPFFEYLSGRCFARLFYFLFSFLLLPFFPYTRL